MTRKGRASALALVLAGGLIPGALGPGPAHAFRPGRIVRASLGPGGAEGDNQSQSASISADGRYVAFRSMSLNWSFGDSSWNDIFVRDRATGTTQLVSVSSSEVPADLMSDGVVISGNGGYVAFESYATNLVSGDWNDKWDVFVRDVVAGTTERVSVSSSEAEANDLSYVYDISPDGRYVVFGSWASNLVAGDTNIVADAFVRDRVNGTTERVSVSSTGGQGNGSAAAASISDDGRYVAFESWATNLIPGGTSYPNVYVRDRTSGTTELISVSSDEVEGDWSMDPAISSDGRYVAFASGSAFDMADTNGKTDVYLRDRTTGTTERVSLAWTGAEGNDFSSDPSVSADARYVSFSSPSTNLVDDDANGRTDVFVRDRTSGSTLRVSAPVTGVDGDENSSGGRITPDGRYVAFSSFATNLLSPSGPGDYNGRGDVFVADLAFQYLALGDGTASGAGLTGAGGPCARAPGAYPNLLAKILGHVEMENLACHGTRSSSLASQAQAALALRDPDIPGLVTIDVGREDLGISDPISQRQVLCDDPDDAVRALAAQAAASVGSSIGAALDTLLTDPEIVVVVTGLYQPFNAYPAYLDDPSVVGGARAPCDPDYPAWRESHRARERAEYLVEAVNAAIHAAVVSRDPYGERVEVAPVDNLFQGREGAQHPSGFCGAAEPAAIQTWIQSPAAGSASRTTTDCLFPNDAGALEIARLIADVIPRPYAPVDASPPRSRLHASDLDVLIPQRGDVLRGQAVDGGRGVDHAEVTFAGPAGLLTTLVPIEPGIRACSVVRRGCAFEIAPPGIPGVYAVTTVAVDRAGNREPAKAGITVMVV